MPTNFPSGISSYGLPVLPSGSGGPPAPNAAPTLTAVGSGQTVKGPSNVYFVSSVIGADGNSGKHMLTGGPLATLVQALTMVSPGDTIYLMPGHVENIVAALTIDIKVKCLQIIGMGTGNQRPTFVFKTATTATFRINATTGDGCYIYNCRFQSQIANLAQAFLVAAKDVTFDAVDYYDDGTNDITQGFLVTGVNCTIKNCYWTCEIANVTVLSWITLTAAQGFRCYNNFAQFAGLSTANPANGIIVGLTTLSKHLDIRGNFFSIDNGGNASVVISLVASSTGLVAYNGLNSTGKTAIAGINAIANCKGYQNFVTHTANKNGLLDPVVDA